MTGQQLITIPRERSFASKFNARRVNPDLRFAVELQHAEKAVAKNPDLRDCEQESFGHALLEAAAIGVTLNPALAHAYLIPWKSNGVKRAELHVGYRGMEAQVLDAGTIKDIQTDLVCAGDPVFDEWLDEDGYKRIRHQKARGQRGEVTHAYCIAHYAGGGMHVEVMDRASIDACEKAASARSAKGGAVWRSAFKPEMMKKVCVRRAWKHWPKDSAGRMERLMQFVEDKEPMNFEAAELDEGPAEICLSGEQVMELEAVLSDHGVPDGDWERWLKRLAEVHGRAQVEDLPASNFDAIKKQFTSYAKQWADSQGAGNGN